MGLAEEKETWLRQVELFHGVEGAELHLIAQRTREQSFTAGDVVFREGDPGDRLFVLLTGTMHVYVEREGTVVTYNVMQAGECFGEMALIEDRPRSATVRATEASRCLTLSKQDFLDLLHRHPHIALSIIKGLCQRLHHTNAQLQHYARQLADTRRR